MLSKLMDNVDWEEGSKIISYEEAKTRKDKEGVAYTITFVNWDKQAEKDAARQVVNLHTVGEITIMLAPPLPKGYRMVFHTSWNELRKEIYNPEKASIYTFDYLDKACCDDEILSDLGIRDFNFLVDTSLHPDYVDWCYEYEESWNNLDSKLSELVQSVTKESLYQRGKLPCRRMAPTTKQALLQMLELLDKE